MGFEPTTTCVEGRYSTVELHPQLGEESPVVLPTTTTVAAAETRPAVVRRRGRVAAVTAAARPGGRGRTPAVRVTGPGRVPARPAGRPGRAAAIGRRRVGRSRVGRGRVRRAGIGRVGHADGCDCLDGVCDRIGCSHLTPAVIRPTAVAGRDHPGRHQVGDGERLGNRLDAFLQGPIQLLAGVDLDAALGCVSDHQGDRVRSLEL